EPRLSGRMQDAAIGEVETGENVLLDVAHPVFHAALFLALAHMARPKATSVVRSKVRLLGIEHWCVAQGPLEPSRFEVIDPDLWGHGAKERQGMVVAGEEGFHGLGDGALTR